MATETPGGREEGDHKQKPALADLDDGDHKQKPVPIDLDDGNHKQKRVHDTDDTLLAGLDDTDARENDDKKDPDASSSDKLLDERRVLKGSCSRCGLVHCDYMVTAWIYGLDEFDCNILLPGIDDSDDKQSYMDVDSLAGNSYVPESLADDNQKPALADLDDGDHKQKPALTDVDDSDRKQKLVHDTDDTLLAGLDDTDDTNAHENDDKKDPDVFSSDKLLDVRRVLKGSCSRCGLVHCDYMVTAWIYGLDEFDCNILLPGIDDSDDKQSYTDVDSVAGNSYIPKSLADVECIVEDAFAENDEE